MFVCETAAQLLLQFPDAKMTETEKEAIRDPLSEALQKMFPAVSETVNTLALPIALVTAFGFWGYRIVNASQVYHQQVRESRGEYDYSSTQQNPAYRPTPDQYASPGNEGINEQPNFKLG